MAGCRSLEMERVAVMGQARLSRCSELQNDKSPARLLFRYAILCLNSFIASLPDGVDIDDNPGCSQQLSTAKSDGRWPPSPLLRIELS